MKLSPPIPMLALERSNAVPQRFAVLLVVYLHFWLAGLGLSLHAQSAALAFAVTLGALLLCRNLQAQIRAWRAAQRSSLGR